MFLYKSGVLFVPVMFVLINIFHNVQQCKVDSVQRRGRRDETSITLVFHDGKSVLCI